MCGLGGLGMGLPPHLPPNFLVSNGATSYPHLLSPDRKAAKLSTRSHLPTRVFFLLQLAAIKPLMPAKCPQTRRGHKKPLRSNKGQVGSGLGLMQKVAQSGLSATPPHLQAVSKKFPDSI